MLKSGDRLPSPFENHEDNAVAARVESEDRNVGPMTWQGNGADPGVWREPRAAKACDRRSALRYPAVIGRAWLGWSQGSTALHRPAWVLDVSAGGCLLAAEGAPPPTAPAFIRLVGPYLPHWFPVRVLDVQESDGPVSAVRVLFPEGCPYDLFMGLVYGRFPKL